METQIGKEKAQQNRLKEELEVVRRHVSEATGDIDHIESELKAVKELEAELRTRLEEFDLENSWFETQLAKAMREKSEMERRAETLRRKRDAIRQQIEQCKLRELSKLWPKPYRDFTADEIRDATGGFSGDLQIGAGERSTVYRAKICHIDVAVKFSVEFSTATAEKFRAEVIGLLFSSIRPDKMHSPFDRSFAFCIRRFVGRSAEPDPTPKYPPGDRRVRGAAMRRLRVRPRRQRTRRPLILRRGAAADPPLARTHPHRL